MLEQSAMTQRRAHSRLLSVVLVLVLACTWLTYQQGLPGFFMLDDYDNLGALRYGVTDVDSLEHYLSIGNAGPLGRPVAKMSFLLDDNAWPSAPEGFKQTNILLHLIMAVLVFTTCRLLFRESWTSRSADWSALAVAAFWALHPLNVSTTLYVVQRMTQLAAIFVLAGVIAHLWFRLRSDLSRPTRLLAMTGSLCFFTALAAYSKESGSLLPVFLLIVEHTVLLSRHCNPALRWWRRIFLAAPTAALVLYLAYLPKWINSYSNRDFSIWERLATQPVVLFDYLGKIVSTDIYGVGVFQDDFPVFSDWLSPVVVLSTLGIALGLFAALYFRRKWPVACLGVLWFLGGHLLESTTVSLEIYFEHRNYLPMIGILVVLAAGLRGLLVRLPPDIGRWSLLLIVGLWAITSFKTFGLTESWASEASAIPLWAVEHPDSPRAQRTYAYFLAGTGHPDIATTLLTEEYERFSEDMTFPIMAVDIACTFNTSVSYDLYELAQRAGEHVWTNAIRPTMTNLYERVDQWNCPEQAAALDALVDALPYVQKAEYNRRALAAIFTLHGQYKLDQRLANDALDAFVTADRLAEKPDTALRVADVYIAVRDYSAARDWLSEARHRSLSGVTDPSRRTQLIQDYEQALARVHKLEQQFGDIRQSPPEP